MCSLTVGLMAASTGLAMYNNNMQARAQSNAYRAQADAAKQNAAIIAHKAEVSAENYAIKQKQMNNKFKLAMGNARAQAGASGISADSGSLQDVLDSSSDAYKEDSQNLLRSQREDSWASYVEQANELNKMNAYNTMAKNAKRQARINNIGTFLSDASSIYGQGYKEGLWGSSK